MKLTDYFERVYVINLPYKEDRKQRLENHLMELDLADLERLCWVQAISGEYCNPPEWFNAGNGAWGCLQSHLRVAQNATMEGVNNYLVLEDDVVFSRHSKVILSLMFESLPDDWDQLYLGGQHLHEPEVLSHGSFIYSCNNVNRTHAYAVSKNNYKDFQQHIMDAPDYIERGGWHIDHQLGLAHERKKWRTYAPIWWVAGQDDGSSNISGARNPRLWWHSSKYSQYLPFIFLDGSQSINEVPAIKRYVHFGNKLKVGTLEDEGLDVCVGLDENLKCWLDMIAREAIDMGLLPGIYHPGIKMSSVEKLWSSRVFQPENVNLELLCNYPFNGLIEHSTLAPLLEMM